MRNKKKKKECKRELSGVRWQTIGLSSAELIKEMNKQILIKGTLGYP